VTIVFCGSKKSLFQGITIAKMIFASHAVGSAVLPLMLFPSDPADGLAARSRGALSIPDFGSRGISCDTDECSRPLSRVRRGFTFRLAVRVAYWAPRRYSLN
jgi:SBF-like CPA transporter family (DUF4137)